MQALSQYAEGVLNPSQLTPLVIDLVRSATRHEETLDGVKTQLGSIEVRMTDVSSHLSAIKADLGTIDRRMFTIEETQRRLDVNVGELRSNTSAGFQGIQNRLAVLELKHDTHVADVKANFDSVTIRLDTIDQRFNAMDERLDAMDTRFDAMDERFNAMDERLGAMEARFDKRFDALEGRIDVLETRFTSMEMQLVAIAAAVGAEIPNTVTELGC